MKNRNTAAFVLIFLLTISAVVLFARPAFVQPTPIAQQQPTNSPPELFTPVNPPSVRGRPTLQDPKVIRQRFVRADFSLLTRTRGRSLRLNLFDDVAYNVIIDSVESTSGQTRGQSGSVQLGRIEGMPDSEVYLASRGNTLSGNIRVPDGKFYQIRSVSSGVQAVREINQAAFPPDHPPGVFKAIQKRSATRSTRSSRTEMPFVRDAVIQVIVLYTPETLQAAGGTDDAIASAIALAQAETNKGFANSKIPARLRVVASRKVDYPESGEAQTDLDRLMNPSDGFLDDILALRQQYRADAVSLWVSNMDACGIGSLNKSASEFRDRAFSVVSLDCATGVYSFAHELGHNLGATHDPDNSEPGEGLFPYSHGYQDPNGKFRTIMAYKTGCSGECPRINAWSSPKGSYNGKPLGIPNRANNVQTLSQTL
jgi:hypothetical protein